MYSNITQAMFNCYNVKTQNNVCYPQHMSISACALIWFGKWRLECSWWVSSGLLLDLNIDYYWFESGSVGGGAAGELVVDCLTSVWTTG